ncbi:MAG: dihydrofolate reductase family protein, partial [Chromatiales bacterium]|nr:dihydrofolate reductase family protein [Chromatiales bacterium]
MLQLAGETLILCSPNAVGKQDLLSQAGAQIIQVEGDAQQLDLLQVLTLLADREVNELLIEAGAVLAGAALAAGLVDELIIYAAPIIMGDGARGLLHLPGLERMQDKIELELIDLRQVGRDVRITLKPKFTANT